uniref:Uncharacterized protein n=1 Tax=Panagrolaimus superbus TaxID=310955 RepID=A0A914YGP1_9BILA
MRMTRRQIEDSNEDDDGIEVIERNHQVSGPRSEEEESSSQPTRSYQNISSISIDSLTPKKQFKDDATIIKEIQRHAGAQDSGDTASKSSLRSYTPEVTSETEIPVKVHILRLDSNMLLDVPFIREPINEWLQDHKIPPYIPHEKPGGDWHHLDEQGVQLKFSDIPTVSGSSQSSSTLSHENELSESEVELVKEVVNNPK